MQYIDGDVHTEHTGTKSEWRCLPFYLCGHIAEGMVHWHLEHETIVAHHGEAIFIPAWTRNKYETFAGEQTVLRWAHFTIADVDGNDPLARLHIPTLMVGSTAATIGKLCTELAYTPEPISLPALARQARQEMRLLKLVAELASHGTEHAPTSAPNLHVRLTAVVNRLHAHPEEALDIDAMAEEAGLSPSRFHVVFKSYLGRSPLQYQQNMRLRKARRLLLTTNLTVEEVGLCVGYANPDHFARLFKAYYGSSPRYYASCMHEPLSEVIHTLCS